MCRVTFTALSERAASITRALTGHGALAGTGRRGEVFARGAAEATLGNLLAELRRRGEISSSVTSGAY